MVSSPWRDWGPATCLPDHCFCEAIRDGLVAQPANTWSSLAFVAVAFALLARRRDAAGLTLAGAILVIGLGSMFFHASLTLAGQFVDVLGMYLLVNFLLLHGISTRWRLPGPAFAGLYLLANAATATILYAAPQLRRYVFAALLLAAILAQARAGWRLVPALAVLGLGFAVWVLDLTRVACAPDSLLQGHAFWHLCGAVAAWLIAAEVPGEATG